MDDFDIVAGAVEQVAGLGLFLRQKRCDQGEVGLVEVAQQIVERPVALWRIDRVESALEVPHARETTIIDPTSVLCSQVHRQQNADVMVSVPEPVGALPRGIAAAVRRRLWPVT